MNLLAKSSKWTITNSSFFMRSPKWRRNLWRTSLWSSQFYMMMCLEWHLRSFLPFSFICRLFVCMSLHAQIEDNVNLKCGGGFRKFIFSDFCFLYFLFLLFLLLFLFLYSISGCVCICFLFLFSYIMFCLFFCICSCMLFLSCCICFVLFFC